MPGAQARGWAGAARHLSLMFCCRREESEFSSGMSVSPLQGRKGQSVRVHALRSLRCSGGEQPCVRARGRQGAVPTAGAVSKRFRAEARCSGDAAAPHSKQWRTQGGRFETA